MYALIDKPFLAGLSALLLWATSATFLASLTHIPALQAMILVLSCACLASIIRLSQKKRWHTLKGLPPLPTVLAGLGLAGNHLCYFLAFHYAPAVEVDLIFYCWPLASFFVLMLQGKMAFKIRSLMVLLLGFSALVLISPDAYQVAGYPHATLGWGIGIVGTACWILYATNSQNNPKAPIELIGLYAGAAALIALIFTDVHTWVTPTLLDSSKLLSLSLLSSTYAYWAWDWAIKQHQLNRLILFANTTPILSVWLLCLFGYATWSLQLALATLLLVGSLFLIKKR